MSKSLGNYVSLNDPPTEMFGKIMSISDELMARYYELLLGRNVPVQEHPLEAKKQLAFEIVETYHSRAAADKARDEWTMRFSERKLEQAELPAFAAVAGDLVTVVVKAFAVLSLTKSRAEASRLIKQGSVQLNGEKILDPKAMMNLQSGQVLRLDKTHAVRVG
jgi:tyrosyl-tRNA synthetase